MTYSLRQCQIITDNDENVHVSGHPSRDELIEMYSFVKPKISIPVHGTREHIDAHAKLANECQVPIVFKPKNGEAIKLNSPKPCVFPFKFRGQTYFGQSNFLIS